jgi:hypothetical protein
VDCTFKLDLPSAEALHLECLGNLVVTANGIPPLLHGLPVSTLML